MSVHSVITSMQNHVGDIYDTIELANAEATDKNIVNISPTWRAALLDMMNNGTDTLWDNWTKVIGEGTDIKLNNVMGNVKFDYQFKGNINQGDLPDRYQQVEYIESNGNQWIDLQYTPNENIKIACKFAHNESTIDTPVFGCRAGSYGNAYILWSHPSEYGAASIKTTILFNSLQVSLDRYTQGTVIDFEYDSAGGTYGDQEWTWSPGTGNPQVNMVLFTCRTGTAIEGRKFSGKMWKFKLWDNGTLKRDLIPCYRKSDNVVGMYDMVTGTFYVNKGTGNFTYSRLAPAPDTPLNTYVTTGNQTVMVMGKNLINIPEMASTTVNGVTHKVENQTIFLSGTNTKTDTAWSRMSYGGSWIIPFPLEIGKTYTIKPTGSWPTDTYFQINAVSRKTGSQYALITCWGGKTTFTIDEDFNGVVNVFLGILKTATVVDGAFKIQLEKGDTATEWEPCQKNKYNIDLGNTELYKVGNYQDRIFKNSGKNLIQDTKISSSNKSRYQGALFIEADLKPDTTYTFSFYGAVGNRYYINENLFYYQQLTITSEKAVITARTQSVVDKSRANQYTSGYGWQIFKNDKDQDSNNVFNELMLNEGSTVLPYEPYGKDEWYLGRKINKVVLDGTENWNLTALFYTYLFSPYALAGTIDTLCSNNFIYRINAASDYSIFVPGDTGTGNNVIWLRANDMETTEDLKTWLSTHNTVIYYVLFTPTYTKITDSTLLNQLNAIQLFEGTNNIATSGNLNGIIAVTALEDLQLISAQSEV